MSVRVNGEAGEELLIRIADGAGALFNEQDSGCEIPFDLRLDGKIVWTRSDAGDRLNTDKNLFGSRTSILERFMSDRLLQ